MRLEARQNSTSSPCISVAQCPPITCQCGSNYVCHATTLNCSECPTAVCVPKAAPSSGISTGVLAGSVISVFILAVAACAAFFWWRRRKAAAKVVPEKPVLPRDVPANPEAVLSRPDPLEKSAPAAIRSHPAGTDAASHRSVDADSFLTHDPFADQATIQTASARTHSPNVITIGIMSPADGITSLSPSPSAGPQRPVRSPDLSLRSNGHSDVNLAHVNVSNDSLQPPSARFAKAKSVRSVRTTASGMSALSAASSVMDIISEPPQIVSPAHGAVRQVLGVVKAEVVQAPVTPSGPGLQPLARAPSRPGRSPLAQSSFTREDLNDEDNPFAGGDSSTDGHMTCSTSIKSTSTFGQHASAQGTPTQWSFPPTPTWPMESRPVSIQSNVGTIIADIGSATRVVFGMQSPQYSTGRQQQSHQSTATMATTVPPGTPPPTATESEDDPRRMSQASVASTHADSILEAFPFVPPSPIAARPPRSPMAVSFTPPSPDPQAATSMAQQQGQQSVPPSVPPTPTQRSPRALSTMSNSSGLTAFPFKFNDEETPPMPRNSKRASLDTLALSRDLEAFPLPYDDPLRRSITPSTK